MGERDKKKNFKTQLQNLLLIEKLIKNKEYPTVEQLSLKIGHSVRQIERLIKCLKEEFNAPIEKDKNHNNGFYYKTEEYSFLDVTYDENEKLALGICSDLIKNLFFDTELYNKVDKGLSSIKNLSKTYHKNEGDNLSSRIHFAINKTYLGRDIRKRQENFEEILFDVVKEGKIVNISVKENFSNNVKIMTGLPLFIFMHKDFSWNLFYIKKEAFSEDFKSINLTLECCDIIQISSITAINFYKNPHAKEFCVENQISSLFEGPVSPIEELGKDSIQQILSFSFFLTFPALENSPRYNILARYLIDRESFNYTLDRTSDIDFFSGVFLENF